MELSSIHAENERLREALLNSQSQLKNYEQEVERLRELVRKFKRMCFGRKSERVEDVAVEQLVFNEIEVLTRTEPEVEPKQTVSYTRGCGRQKKKPYAEELEREVVVHDLAEAEKVCSAHGEKLQEIGEEVSEKLVTYPARVVIREERTKKYIASCCESVPKQATVVSILPKTIATPELLSFLIFSKFFQALPLYRLEELYKLFGVQLSRGTMARWLIVLSEKLRPIWNVLEERMFESGYMGIDATSIQVLKEKGRSPQSKSFMWIRGSPEKGIVLFDYHISGAGSVAKSLVEGFMGALQSDAHGAYNQLDESSITRLGCMMHARRKFHDAAHASPKGTGLAHTGFSLIRKLYDLDDLYKEKALSAEQRYLARQKEHIPVLEELKSWAMHHRPLVPPKSQIGIAFNYLLDEWERLTRYLKNGRYEMDNGWVERVIRKFAIGRNNWLFADTTDGAEASSVLYSLALTAKLNGKDPFAVMVDILKQLPLAEKIEDYERLTNLLLSEEKVPIGKDAKPFHYRKRVRCA